jgi:predicted DNA-binding protein (UPF0251 family)
VGRKQRLSALLASRVQFLRNMVRRNSGLLVLEVLLDILPNETYLGSNAKSRSIAMPAGRPTVYTPDNAEIARLACMLGATNETLAERFEVSRRTIDNWIATIPEFGNAIRQGRQVADETVISALFARATGRAEDDQGLLLSRPAGHGELHRAAAARDARLHVLAAQSKARAVAREPPAR